MGNSNSKIFFSCLIDDIFYTHICFYYRQYDGQSYATEKISDVLQNSNFDRNKPTAIYCYGFAETLNFPSVRGVVDAYQQNRNFNFMVISSDSLLTYTVFVSCVICLFNIIKVNNLSHRMQMI